MAAVDAAGTVIAWSPGAQMLLGYPPEEIVGRPAASLKGFNYSDAMKKRGAEGLKWDAATLNAYVADPQAIVPGTRMSAAPLRDEQARADLIAYLAKSGAYQP